MTITIHDSEYVFVPVLTLDLKINSTCIVKEMNELELSVIPLSHTYCKIHTLNTQSVVIIILCIIIIPVHCSFRHVTGCQANVDQQS